MRKRGRKQAWQSGDCFLIPLLDGSFLMGQVLAPEPRNLNSLSCGLFNQRSNGDSFAPPDLAALFSTLFTTRDLLDSGDWKVVANFPVELPKESFPFEQLRDSGFVGSRIIGSGNVMDFANAYCGLAPWDKFLDPAYLDRLLLSPQLKPSSVIYKRDMN